MLELRPLHMAMAAVDVAVIGLGAMGAATLYELAARGQRVIGIDRFGASAPGPTVFKEYGFTVDHVVDEVLALVRRKQERGQS